MLIACGAKCMQLNKRIVCSKERHTMSQVYFVAQSISACCSCLMTIDMLAEWPIPPVALSKVCMQR